MPINRLYIFPVLITFILPTYLIRLSIFGVPTTVLELAIYFSFMFIIVYKSLQDGCRYVLREIVSNRIFRLWAMLTVWVAVVVLLSPDFLVAAGIWKAYFFDALLLVVVFVLSTSDNVLIRYCLYSYFFSAVTVTTLAMLAYCFFGFSADRLSWPYGSPNYLSMYIAPAIFIGLHYFITRFRGVGRVIAFFSLLVLVSGIYLTFSRGAWLGVVAAFSLSTILLGYYKYRLKSRLIDSRSPVLLAITAFAIGLLVIGYGIYPRLFANRAYQSDSIRVAIWSQSLEFIKGNPIFGIGLGNYQTYFKEKTKGMVNYPEFIVPHAITPHNMLMNLWLQIGLLGTAVFVVMIFTVFRQFARSFHQGSKKDRALGVVVFSTILVILVQGFFDSTIWKNDLILVFIVLLLVFSRLTDDNTKTKMVD